MKKDFIREIKWRGLLQDATPGTEELFQTQTVTAYAGFDPTASSLHVGNLIPVMLLVHLQRCGHKPIALVGGATGMIGDPSGKAQERTLLSQDVLIHNQTQITRQLKSFLDFETPEVKAEVVNNYTWYEHFRLLDFLRDVGKHLTVNYMAAKDSVKNRMDTGISFTEFSYQLLQAYDFFYLYKQKNCRLQLGGSDQWGNMTSGTELIRRMSNEETHAHALTAPLLTKADGSKFGKSESGNVWLDPTLTSPFRFYQFFLNVADEDLPKLIKIFSLKEEEEINEILNQSANRPELRTGQKLLAAELTERIHGKSALIQAEEATQILFGQSTLEMLKSLSEELFTDIFGGVPTAHLERNLLESGLSVVDLLTAAGAKPSKTESKKAVQAGSVQINKAKAEHLEVKFTKEDLLGNKFMLIEIGKKQKFLAVFD